MGVALATRSGLSRVEWDLRVQLAGAYRIADHLGWSELIYTHISARIPGRQRLAKSFAKHDALILRNHGLLTIGETIPSAFIRFWRLNRACEIQLAAQSAKLRLPSAAVREASYAMGEEFLTDQAPQGQLEFNAILRKIEAT